MSDKYLSLVVEATVSVFETMLGAEVSPCDLVVAKDAMPPREISGIIGLSGQAKGMVTLSLGREAALSATEALLGTRPTCIDGSVADAVGELTNMVAGMVKCRLSHLNLNMSLPSVVTGKSHCIVFPSDVVPVCLLFDTPWGEAVIEFGLEEAATNREMSSKHRHEVA